MTPNDEDQDPGFLHTAWMYHTIGDIEEVIKLKGAMWLVENMKSGHHELLIALERWANRDQT